MTSASTVGTIGKAWGSVIPQIATPLLGFVRTTGGLRRVNYYVKHLVQDLDGQPSETLSWLEDYGDPNLISSLDMLSPSFTSFHHLPVPWFTIFQRLSPSFPVFHHLTISVRILPASCGTVWHPPFFMQITQIMVRFVTAWLRGLVAPKSPQATPRFITRLDVLKAKRTNTRDS